jgi:hypothetical protein
MADILNFPKPKDSPLNVLNDAAMQNLRLVVVIGIDSDDCLYFNSSSANHGDILYQIEKAKHHLLSDDL